MIRNLDKHKKYKGSYRANELYWGLGVEHEIYIETNKVKKITLKGLKENTIAERYCIDYYNVYTKDLLNRALDGLFEENKEISIPILMNSHTFQKTDINNEHQMTLERIPKPNPLFNGKTFFEWIKEENPDIFKNNYEKSYIFDGDTIEFITQNFYKTTMNEVISELEEVQKEFICALNLLPSHGIIKEYGPFKIAPKNYPFASYITNLKNNAMFNNGTIHINITLPTKLDKNTEIEDFELFKEQHRNYARAIQWISPLLVAMYGSPDPLCESKNNGDKYSAGSQRISVSRYIGLGTFDTDIMEIGKVVTKKKEELKDIDWYYEFHKIADYKFLDEIGMDINFNKHYCHGIELRIFESLPIDDLKEILKIMIYLADFSLSNKLHNPKKFNLWNRIAKECVHNGKKYNINVSDQHELFNLFNISHSSKEPMNVCQVLEIIKQHLITRYDDGICVKYMIKGEELVKEELKNDKTKEVKKVEEVAIKKSMFCC
jgi:uncharacterized protein YeeX (DUF496 family)